MTLIPPTLQEVYPRFYQFLSEFVDLSPASAGAILAVTKQIQVSKGTLLVTEDEPCRHLYFMRQGAAHLFFGQGKKRVTTWIALDNDLITSVESISDACSVRRNVEILEDSEILSIRFEALNQLFNEFHEVEKLGRLLTMHHFTLLNRKMRRNYFLTAKERYERLLEYHPEVAWRIPLGVVASYLNMSQETLSRIRNPKYGK